MESFLMPDSTTNESSRDKKNNLTFRLVAIFLIILVAGFLLFFFRLYIPKVPVSTVPLNKPLTVAQPGVVYFASEKEFKDYLQKSQSGLAGYKGLGLPLSSRIGPLAQQGVSADSGTPSQPGRVSQTNVQVKGIDEPDIVKTDGKNIFFSQSGNYYPMLEGSGITPGVLIESSIKILPPYPLPLPRGGIKIINAFPPANLSLQSTASQSGDLLLNKNILAIFSYQNIFGFDVSNPQNPTQVWKIDLEKSQRIVTSRLYKDKIYLVTESNLNFSRPCPIQPLSLKGVSITIPCARIYHPISNISVDVTYNAMVIDPKNGKIEKSVSFVGSTGKSVIYMSANNLYITYSYLTDELEIMLKFYQEKGKGLIADEAIKQLDDLKNLKLSSQAKQVEMQIILERYLSSLSDDERVKNENETQNRLKDFSREHLREFEKTGIAKINLESLDVTKTGLVAGSLLNQFSMDEYQDNLRVATTVSGANFGSGDEANDIYILNKDLNVIGSLVNLGLGERIYSTRFIEDKGYLVTFKQTDPFFVLDLTSPSQPEIKGQLKIPGFSSYLDLIAKDRVLGIGKEVNNVKLSFFDVSSATNPAEISKYSMDEYWSDIQNTHHAFLLDDKNKIFFLPGSKGGYIFSYDNDSLSLKTVVSGSQIKRAVFIDNYLYIVGEDKIVALDESNWQEVKSVTFNQ